MTTQINTIKWRKKKKYISIELMTHRRKARTEFWPIFFSSRFTFTSRTLRRVVELSFSSIYQLSLGFTHLVPAPNGWILSKYRIFPFLTFANIPIFVGALSKLSGCSWSRRDGSAIALTTKTTTTLDTHKRGEKISHFHHKGNTQQQREIRCDFALSYLFFWAFLFTFRGSTGL